MPEAKKNISADTKRSILQHLMFGMLGLLILMNWTVHRPLDYEPFNETFEVNSIEGETFKKLQIEKIRTQVLNFYDTNALKPYENTATRIVILTDSVIGSINSTKMIISVTNIPLKNQMSQIDNTLVLIDNLRDSLLHFFGENNTSVYARTMLINENSIRFCRDIIHQNSYPLEYTTKLTALAVLYALQNQVENTRRMWLDLLYDKVRPGCILRFDGMKAFASIENQNPLIGQNVKGEIATGYYFQFSNKFCDAKVNWGKLDLSKLMFEKIAYWEDIAKHLGKNTVSGTITRLYQKDTITRPFSFSYFVSAPGIAFHLDKANLCYVGVPNPISISVPGYPADKINLKVAGAKVSKIEDGRFEIFFSKIPAAKVYAYVEATNEQGRTSTVHSMELKVKELPAPITNLESFKEGGISLEELKNLKSIKVQSLDSAFAMEYEVISFQVEGITQDSKYIEPITVHGYEFFNKQELKSVFNAATTGDRFIFSNIRAKAANGKEYEALPVSILLK